MQLNGLFKTRELFFAVLFFLIVNQSFFNFAFENVGFDYWKQIIAPVFLVLIFFAVKLKKGLLRETHVIILPFFFLYAFLAYGFFAFLWEDVSFTWFFYRAIGFIWFIIPLLLMMYAKKKVEVFKVVSYICLFIGFGVIADAFVDFWDVFKSVEVDASSGVAEGVVAKRSDFFVGSSSNLFVILSLPLVFYLSDIPVFKRGMLVFYILVSIFAIYLSGSRLSLILFISLVSFGYLFHYKKIASKLFFACLSITCLVLVVLFVHEQLSELRVFQVLDPSDPGNRGRLRYYFWFFSNYQDFSEVEAFFGHGIGYLLTESNAYPSIHFESSLISMLIEVGVFGSFLFYLVFFLYLACFSSAKIARLWFLFLFLTTVFVPAFLSYQIMFCMGLVFSLKIVKGDVQSEVTSSIAAQAIVQRSGG
ncbi:O-antigen ligase family protein [Halomonas salinarum]|uniref:O-antigen ligase family protein n=1 Tax=Halomonas salinarum TaxID=1158993 RepID=UPI00143A64EE|nr:O-antigen ligase family protein [Halomonas salinarum]